MNRQTFIQLVQNPSEISPEQAAELEKVVAGFPYCQAAHILLAKQASDNGSMLADLKLKKAAAYTADRKNLKRLLTSSYPTEEEALSIAPPDPASQEDKTGILETNETFTPIPTSPAEPIVQDTQPKPESTPKSTPHTSVSSQDKLLAELQANLQRLHDLKIKITEETTGTQSETPTPLPADTSSETSLAEVSDTSIHSDDVPATENQTPEQDPATDELQNSPLLPKEEIKITDEEISEVPLQETVPTPSEAPSTEPLPVAADSTEEEIADKQEAIESETSEQQTEHTATEPDATSTEQPLTNQFVAPLNSLYPLRTEGVYLSVAEHDDYHTQLQHYLDFLEEKRSVFRKNKKKEEEIINKISKTELTIPKLDRNNLPDNSVDLSSKSSTIAKGPISENFAKILTLQGKTDKAIEIYEQLILKIPEKKPYFEAQIEKLKNKL